MSQSVKADWLSSPGVSETGQPSDESGTPTLVTGSVPAGEFALGHTMESLPDLLFEVEQVVVSGDEVPMPLLRVRGSGRERVEETLAADPTVDDAELVGDFEEEWLFRVEWTDRIALLARMLTSADATVLDAVGCDGQWQFRMLYPDRALFSQTHAFCEAHGLTFDIEAIRTLEGEPAGRYGLSNKQYRALTEAVEQGYFEVPRAVSLKELAEELGTTHQAASELLRRGTNALLEEAFFTGLNE